MHASLQVAAAVRLSLAAAVRLMPFGDLACLLRRIGEGCL